jgi:hypothetical protein
VSLAVIAAEALRTDRFTETARRLARDVAHYDQQACLSPHVVYVEQSAGEESAGVPLDVFAAAVATELAAVERRSPRAPLTLEEAAAWAHAREEAEFAAWDDDSRTLLTAGDDSPWAVSIEPLDAPFEASPLGRFVRLVPVTGASAIAESLAAVRGVVQSAGLACAPQRVEEFGDALAASGVDRVAALGRMGAPAPGWHHDGRAGLGELVTWTDLEPSLDWQLEVYEPDDRSGGGPVQGASADD